MTTTINASTSSGLVVTPDNSGLIKLQYNGNPAPAFSTYMSGNQTITNDTWTAANFDTVNFNTGSCYSTSTKRFTPNVAGYYQLFFSATVVATTSKTYAFVPAIYKNGSANIFRQQDYYLFGSADHANPYCQTIMYFNGTTDYVQPYFYSYCYTSTTNVVLAGAYPNGSEFNGFLVGVA